jgi:hypothetical protein
MSTRTPHVGQMVHYRMNSGRGDGTYMWVPAVVHSTPESWVEGGLAITDSFGNFNNGPAPNTVHLGVVDAAQDFYWAPSIAEGDDDGEYRLIPGAS